MDKLYRDSSTLPVGSIQAKGWLRDWLQVSADGWMLDFATQKHKNIWPKFFWNRNNTHEVEFDENNQTITLCDYTAYLVDSMMRHAVMLPDCRLRREAEEWVRLCLEYQDEDGYIGAFTKPHRYKHWLEVFSQCLTFEGLLYWYEGTGDKAVLDAVKRGFDNLTDAWNAPETCQGIYGGHGAVYLRIAIKMYELFGDERYKKTAEEIMERYGWQERFLPKKKRGSGAPLVTVSDPLYQQHLVVSAEHVGFPMLIYELTGDRYMRRASEAGYEDMVKNHLTETGTPLGNEWLLNQGPRLGSEHCGSVDWMINCLLMGQITGEVKYFDAAEKVLFNAYPAAKRPDQRLLAYTHCMNELVASETSVPHTYNPTDWWASRAHFHTAHEPLCCNSNSSRAIPWYIDNMIQKTAKGLRIATYGPCRTEIGCGGVKGTLVEETEYPTEDTVRIRISFPEKVNTQIELRVPAWSDKAVITRNGRRYEAEAGKFFVLKGTFRDDEITIEFDNHIRLVEWGRAEFNLRPKAAVVTRGPLVYALHPRETWIRIPSPASAPVQDKKYMEVYRVVAKNGSGWNKAIYADFENPESCMEFVRLPHRKGKPFEYATVGIRVKGRTVKNWKLSGSKDEPTTPPLPRLPMELSETDEEITLVPFGCTRLRMAYIPLVNG
ncbi:MAG: glycoside hydrolase family 127 protein [Eubacteriales bacterium]|nr:glycoside hydrolase family 127 protein [Eubacteriales bacterium]